MASQDGEPQYKLRLNDLTIVERGAGSGVVASQGQDSLTLADRLRDALIPGTINDEEFLPSRLVFDVLTPDVVAEELHEQEFDSPVTLEHVYPDYVIVFGILCLVEEAHLITKFIAEGLSDKHIPLELVREHRRSYELRRRDRRETPLKCFEKLSRPLRENFNKWQWRLTVPFLETRDLEAQHHDFISGTILPWSPLGPVNSSIAKMKSERGGFGSVSCRRIDARCHGFGPLLQRLRLSDGLFAVKTLHATDFNNEAQFRNELDQLKRFNGIEHRNLVTLLASFTLDNRYYFLFPFADSDLGRYFLLPTPPGGPAKDVESIRWFASQLKGLVGAVDVIHNPPHIQARYGIHGDLKPDNILWYKCTDNSRGILAISDMGLSSLHRKITRSNIPGKSIPATPGYRPPECDITDGTVSRSYDIWTLGCIFMEMSVWLLSGKSWLEQFEQDRQTTVYLTGALSDIFFEIKVPQDPEGRVIEGKHVVQVKPVVTQWFDKMHSHPACTSLLHEVLDTIEQEMIVVLSEDRQRSLSGVLKQKFDGFYDKCLSADDTYCTLANPRKLSDVPREEKPVEAHLNANATELLLTRRPKLQTYQGAIRRSARPDQLKELGNMQRPNP